MQKGTKRHLSLGESVARLVSLGARNGLKVRNVRPFLLIHFYIRFHTYLCFAVATAQFINFRILSPPFVRIVGVLLLKVKQLNIIAYEQFTKW